MKDNYITQQEFVNLAKDFNVRRMTVGISKKKMELISVERSDKICCSDLFIDIAMGTIKEYVVCRDYGEYIKDSFYKKIYKMIIAREDLLILNENECLSGDLIGKTEEFKTK